MRVIAFFRVIFYALVTFLCAALPAVVRILTLGADRPARASARWAQQTWCRAGCAMLGVRRVVHGSPPIGVFVVASNHLSYLDILVLGSLYPTAFISKREVANWPLFGFAARIAGTIFVDRASPRDLVRVAPRIKRSLASGVPVTLFPEGRITTGASVIPFMPSLLSPAAQLGTPCWPVGLSYEVDDPGVEPSYEVCWPTDTPLVAHMMNVARMRGLRAIVRFGEAPIVSGNRKDLAIRLHEAVSARVTPIRQPEEPAACAP